MLGAGGSAWLCGDAVMFAKIAIDCYTEDAFEAHRKLAAWLGSVEAGELDADEITAGLQGVIDLLIDQQWQLRRSLGS